MTIKNLTSKFILAFLALGIFSCSSDDSEPTQEKTLLTVSFNTIQSTDAQSSQFKIPSDRISFATGIITIEEIGFEAESADGLTEIEFELEQQVVIDFATGLTTPDIGFISIPAGFYEEVEIEMELADDLEMPAMVLNGAYVSPEGEIHQVRFEFNSGETFEVEREGSIVFEENETAVAQITIDPRAWFAQVTDDEMLGATKDINGVIVISTTQNSDIFDIVADGLDLASEVEIED